MKGTCGTTGTHPERTDVAMRYQSPSKLGLSTLDWAKDIHWTQMFTVVIFSSLRRGAAVLIIHSSSCKSAGISEAPHSLTPCTGLSMNQRDAHPYLRKPLHELL